MDFIVLCKHSYLSTPDAILLNSLDSKAMQFVKKCIFNPKFSIVLNKTVQLFFIHRM